MQRVGAAPFLPFRTCRRPSPRRLGGWHPQRRVSDSPRPGGAARRRRRRSIPLARGSVPAGCRTPGGSGCPRVRRCATAARRAGRTAAPRPRERPSVIVRWPRPAPAMRVEPLGFFAQDNPQPAIDLDVAIACQGNVLVAHPKRGRAGRVSSRSPCVSQVLASARVCRAPHSLIGPGNFCRFSARTPNSATRQVARRRRSAWRRPGVAGAAPGRMGQRSRKGSGRPARPGRAHWPLGGGQDGTARHGQSSVFGYW